MSEAIRMGKYAAGTLQVGDHLHLPGRHVFEYTEIVKRIELPDEKLEFHTKVLAGRNENYPEIRAEGTEDSLVIGVNETVEATLEHDAPRQDFDVVVVTTKTVIVRANAPDRVAAENAARWCLSDGHDASDACVIGSESNSTVSVSDPLAQKA